MQCANNLKQIALASNNYHDAYDCYPQGVQFTFDFSTSGHHVALLPYLEQVPLFNAMNFNWIVPWSGANTTFAGPVRPSVYVCPSDTMGAQVDTFDEALYFPPGYLFLPATPVSPRRTRATRATPGPGSGTAATQAILDQSNGMYFRNQGSPGPGISGSTIWTAVRIAGYHRRHQQHDRSRRARAWAADSMTDRIGNGPAWACGWYGDTTSRRSIL